MKNKWFVNLLKCCLTAGLVLTFPEDVYKSEYRWIEEGDINIGVILSIHSSNSLFNCTENIEDIRNVQNVEALSFAVREINKDITILPNVTLGFVMLDDCQSESIALARAIQFMPRDIRSNKDGNLQGKLSGKVPDLERTFYDVIGVIGSYTSKLSIVVANVLNLFGLPQISHTATSDVLSDKSRFPYFFRMVPPDRYQVKAIVSLLTHFDWNHVSIVYSEGSYGGKGVKELQSSFQMMKNGMCIENAVEIAYGATENDIKEILKQLNSQSDTRVIVAFVEIEHAIFISKAVESSELINRFIWIGSDSLSLILVEHPEVCDKLPGSIFLHPHALNLSTQRFTEHLQHLQSMNPVKLSKNPWLEDLQMYYRKQKIDGLNFTYSVRKPQCFYKSHRSRIRSSFVDSFLIDSVYAIAYALDDVVKTHCPPIGRVNVSDCVSTKGIFKELKKIRFKGLHGELEFNADGDIMTQYEVHQCFPSRFNQPPEMRPVGNWDMDGEELNMNEGEIMWTSETLPSSSCPKPCSETIGTIYYFMKKTCCHVCVTCKVNEIVVANATRCEICPERYWPDAESRTTCLSIQPIYFGLQNAVSIGLCAVAIAGALSCLWIIAILVKYRDEHVIKCFSIELSGIILLGTLLTYGLVASFLTRPSAWKCYINHVGFSLTYTLIYAPLLVKTNRIYRIFNAGRKTTRKPCFISTSSQVIISFILIFTQVAIVIMSTSLEPPAVSLHMPQRTVKFVELFCNLPTAGLLSSLSYNLILVVICTFYAFKTRKLPDNYKESRYIAFCVDTTLLIWITFVPTYFTTTRAAAKTTILAVSLLLNASVTVTCLFIPRIYSLYRNLKNTSSNSAHHYKDFRIVKHVVKRKHSPVVEIEERVSASCADRRISTALTSNSDLMSRDASDINFTVNGTQSYFELSQMCTNSPLQSCLTIADMHSPDTNKEKPSFHLSADD